METLEITEQKLYIISVTDPNDYRLGMRVHVVAHNSEQACEKVNAFFNKKHIPHGGLRDISTISSQCVV